MHYYYYYYSLLMLSSFTTFCHVLKHVTTCICACFSPPGIDAPSQVSTRDVTDTTALVTWVHPVANVDGISISFGPGSSPADHSVVELPSTETQYHLGGLIPDTQYEVSMTARKGERSSVPVYDSFLTGKTLTG